MWVLNAKGAHEMHETTGLGSSDRWKISYYRMFTSIDVFIMKRFRLRAAMAARFQSGVAAEAAEVSETGSKDIRSDNDLRVF